MLVETVEPLIEIVGSRAPFTFFLLRKNPLKTLRNLDPNKQKSTKFTPALSAVENDAISVR